jgi:hypothetical protein
MIPSQIAEVQTYPHIRGLCTRTLDLYIADLRSMLQLPFKIRQETDLPPGTLLIDMEGGCNFASCTLVLDVISGLSVCLYFRRNLIGLETSRDRGDRFKEFLESYYPWEYEFLDKRQVGDILWQLLRNPLVHALGILPFTGLSQSINRAQINKSALSLEQVLELENIARPHWLSSTFELVNSTFHVNVPPLYWGLHQLFRNLFSDTNQMRLIETWFENQATRSP